MQPEEETIARTEKICRGCDVPKEIGTVVCWHCYKYHHLSSLKHSGLSLNQWLVSIGRPHKVIPITEQRV